MPYTDRCDDCGWTYTSVTSCTKWLDLVHNDHQRHNPTHTITRAEASPTDESPVLKLARQVMEEP